MSESFEQALTWSAEIWREALALWQDGSWAMVAIAAVALAIFGIGIHVYLGLREREFSTVPELEWREWIERPEERAGPIGELIDSVADAPSLEEAANRFEQLRMSETVSVERDLRVMRICVSAAPLVGLLGTVTGMLATFGALASGSGADKTMGMVAEGISEALITTETGLVIALPGLFLQYQLARKHERYKAFLAHLESVCMQALFRRFRRLGIAS